MKTKTYLSYPSYSKISAQHTVSIKNWQNFVTRIVMNIYFDDKLATSNSFPTIKEPFWTKNQEKNQRNMLTIQRMIFVLEFSQLRWDFYFAHQMYKLISPWSCCSILLKFDIQVEHYNAFSWLKFRKFMLTKKLLSGLLKFSKLGDLFPEFLATL